MSYALGGEIAVTMLGAVALYRLTVAPVAVEPPRARGRLVKLSALVAVALAMVGGALAAARWQLHRGVEDGIRALDDGDYPVAVRSLLRAVMAEPGNAEAHYFLGLAYGRLGSRAGAITQLRDAVRLAEHDSRFHAGLGLAYRETGDEASAVRELEAAVRLRPGDWQYRIGLAGALLDIGQPGPAVARLREAAQIAPRAAEIHLLLATALAREGDHDGVKREYAAVGSLPGGGPLAELAWQELHQLDR